MRSYIIKRLLVMIPTFFGVCLLSFLVLNLAPGQPGMSRMGQDLAASIRGERSQESYRIFREQFNLDKPVLFNAYFRITAADVLEELRAVAGVTATSAARRIDAQQRLEDWGQFAIPGLIDAIQTADDTLVRDVAAYMLRLNARRRLIDEFKNDQREDVRARNRDISAENANIRLWRYSLENPEERKQEVIRQWVDWHDEHRERWQYSPADKARIFFLETRFAAYVVNLLRLDFGVSMQTREPVLATLATKLKYSLVLSVGSLLLAYLIAIPIGIFSSVKKDSPSDRATTVVLFMLYSLPTFFVGALLLYFFSRGSDYENLRWFPTGGWSSPSEQYQNMTSVQQILNIAWHLALPMLCLTYGSLAALSRYMRAGLLEVLRADYVRTARAKGLPERVVIVKHAVRNGLLPILTLLAGLLPAILGGSVIVEYIFGIPGMGLWMIDSIFQRDYNVVMAVTLLSALLVMIGILLSDISYALVDPRISYE